MHTTMKPSYEIAPEHVLETLKRRILVDGFGLVLDLDGCHGSFLRDAVSGREILDFYSHFASFPIGYNHPRLRDADFRQRLLAASTTKVASADVYTTFYAEFVQTVDEIVGLPGFEHFFFIDGGTLAIENALKTAFDWKVRKNLAAGRGEIGSRVLHFRQAFHGRSGYSLSLTNTDAKKTMYFPKFDWPRIDNPKLDFSLPEPQRSADAAGREALAVRQIEEAVARFGHDIAALIIEPIQGEGGDNHFRPEFFRTLRELSDRHDFLLIFDEVQTGVGLTGRMWCCEHFGVLPDILCFGKKMQVCGIMSNTRVDEVDSVFKVSSRINSTWGSNLTDMVRSTEMLRIVRDENLVENAATVGQYLLDGLARLARKHAILTNVRGRGLMSAVDLPNTETRNRFRKALFDAGLLVLNSGESAIRFRPVLDIDEADVDRGLEIIDQTARGM